MSQQKEKQMRMTLLLPPMVTNLCTLATRIVLVLMLSTNMSGVSCGRRRHRSESPAPAVRNTQGESCVAVQQRCASRTGCSIALSNYMLSCGPVVHDEVRQCTRECRFALITLLSMDDHEGEEFMTCDCQGNQMCEEQKRRLEVCHEEVIQAVPTVMDNLTDISCSLAQLICSADTSCYTALNYYYRHCQKLLRGEKCSSKCNNSLTILYSQQKARKLRTCVCDGLEVYDCEQLRHDTETMCLSRQRPLSGGASTTVQTIRHHHHHTVRPPSNGDGSDNNRNNVTNSTSHKPSQTWIDSSDPINTDWEEDYEDEKSQSNDSKKNTASSGCIPVLVWSQGLKILIAPYYLIIIIVPLLLKFTSVPSSCLL